MVLLSPPRGRRREMRRQATLLMAAMAAALVLASGLALAVTRSCSNPDGCALRGTDRNDTLMGFDGPDRLAGFGGNDKLFGGGGTDDLWGGFGDDRLDGGADDDRYRFLHSKNGGWGKEIVTDVAGSDTIDVDVHRGITLRVVIDLTASAKPNIDTRKRSTTADWEGEVIENARGSSGNDTIIGNDADNELYGLLGGADTVSGGGGNDRIYAGNSDVVDCGDGSEDELLVDGSQETVPQNANCEKVTVYNV
jgi:Ca2+-binding RTX toxin-like protein